jgi:hypothetical protein
MSQYRTLNQLLLVKVETTSGEDASPALSDAILIENPSAAAELQTIETNEVTGSLDSRAPIPAGGWRNFSGRVYLKGSGSAGTAPEFDPLLQISTLAPTTLGAPVTGTAQGGAAGSITLASGASSTTDLYKAIPVTTTGGTGSGQTRLATGYNGTTKVLTVKPNWTITPDNTTTYSIPANVRYLAQSSVLKTATVARYLPRADAGDSKLEKVVGCCANAVFTLQARQGCFIDFTGRGSLVAPTDVTPLSAPTYDDVRPLPLLSATIYIDQTQARLSNFTLDLGNEVTMEEDPSTGFGYSTAGITRRRMGGTLRLPKELEATRNAFTAWATGAEATLTLFWGSVAGNKVSVLVDNLVYTGVTDEDVDGFAYDSLPFRLNSADDSFYITFY